MDHWYSQNISPSPRGALGDSFLQQPGTNIGRSSISFIQRDSSVVHGLSSSKRVRYDWDVEWRLAAEASTRVVAKVFEYSDYVQEGSSEEDDRNLYMPSQIAEHTCTTENQLAAALLKRSAGKFWVNLCPPDRGPSTVRGTLPALTLEAALRLLQRHCGLQSYSVLDAMASTHRMKLDTDADSLYCSLVAFSLLNPPGDGTSDALAEQHSNSFYRKRNRQLREPLLPISEHQAHQQRTISSRVRSGSTTTSGYYNCSSGTLQDLVHLGIPPGTLASWKRPLTAGRVYWQRACFFLTRDVVVTVFREPMGASGITSEVMGYFHVPEVHLMELARGPSYLFYKMVEAAVQQLEGVLLSYRKALVGCEEHTFKRGRLLQLRDVKQMRQLHLMQQELRVIRQQLVTADTMLSAMLEMHAADEPCTVVAPRHLSPAPSARQPDPSLPQASNDPRLSTSLPVAGAKALSAEALHAASSALLAADPSQDRGSRKLLNEETLDFMQEVKDDIAARLMETDELVGACKELEGLMSATMAYRTSVFLRLLAAVAVICLPLTCLAVVYELVWGMTTPDDGHDLAYFSALCLMALLTAGALFLLRRHQIL